MYFTWHWHSHKIAPNRYLNLDLGDINCKPKNWELYGNTQRFFSKLNNSESFLSNVSLQGQKPSYSFDN